MVVTLRSFVVFIVQVACPANQRSMHSAVSEMYLAGYLDLLVSLTKAKAYILEPGFGHTGVRCSAQRSVEVMAKTHVVDVYNFQKVVNFPTVFDQIEIVIANRVREHTIVFNRAMNTVLVVAKTEHEPGFVLLVLGLRLLFVIGNERRHQQVHSVIAGVDVYLVRSSLVASLALVV